MAIVGVLACTGNPFSWKRFVGEDELSTFDLREVEIEVDSGLETNPTDYGNPSGGCKKGEISGGIEGDDGVTCLPECTSDYKCPKDVPKGTTAKPECAVIDFKHGKEYCILQCAGVVKGKCPKGAECRKVKN